MKATLKLFTLSLLGATVFLAGCSNSTTQNNVKYDENSWKEIIPADCTYFFDGCNNCSRVEGEEGAACTKMACETYEEPRCTDEEIEISAYNADSWKEIIPADCTYFFDGCNNCSRVEGEEGAACTKMFCETYEEPRCTDEEIDEQISDEEWSEENGEVLDGTENDTIMLDVE